MLIEIKDFACSSRGSISATSADINELSAIASYLRCIL